MSDGGCGFAYGPGWELVDRTRGEANWDPSVMAGTAVLGISSSTMRLRVDGGWLYRVQSTTITARPMTVSETMCFVPDSADTIMTERSRKASAQASADARLMEENPDHV